MGFIFLMIYVPVSVLVINDYLIMREEQKAQRGHVSRLRAELADAKKRIFRYQQQVSILREHLQTDKTESSTSVKEMPLTQPSPQKTRQESNGYPALSEDPWKTVMPPAADIKDLAVFREGERLKVSFKIVNLKDVGALEGYAFVVALDPASSPQELWSYPQTELLPEGVPADHGTGYRFLIRNFKSITMTHELGQEGGLPPILRILVYDGSGKLLRQEEVEVKAEE